MEKGLLSAKISVKRNKSRRTAMCVSQSVIQDKQPSQSCKRWQSYNKADLLDPVR